MNWSSLTLLVLVLLQLSDAEWWYLGVVGPYQGTKNGVVSRTKSRRSLQTDQCQALDFLEPHERQLCRQGDFMVNVLSKGAALAISECMHQFDQNRWNCTIYDDKDVFGRVLKLNGKEKAFIYGISTAGFVYAVTKACSSGIIGNCGCDHSVYTRPFNKFQWGGCSDSTKFGERLSKELNDEGSNNNSAVQSMNLWNNEAGRKALVRNMKMTCKCHGSSSSCSIKICWRELSPFSDVGYLLKNNYNSARMVRYSFKRQSLIRSKLRGKRKGPKQGGLVFLRKSPTFCHRVNGEMGTTGRLCNATSVNADNSCERLCCGPQYTLNTTEVQEECNCRFTWCCKVHCDKCTKTYTHGYCK